MRGKKILVTGSIAYDVLLQYDGSFQDALSGSDLERLSVSFFTPHYARHRGGNAANIAWNLRLLNQQPLIVGTVGNDGGEYLALMEERGISCALVETLRDHVTATAIIGTDSNARQIMFYHPGADAFGSWPTEKLMEERDDIGYAIVGPRNATLMVQAARWYTQAKLPWIFDPGQQLIALSADELLSAVKASSGVIVNTYEWQLLSDRTKLTVDDFLSVNPLLVVTKAEEGMTIYARDEKSVTVKACAVEKVVNPTGAGDALRAGFLSGLVSGWTLEQCGQLGAAIASFVVEQEGTLLDNLTSEDLESRVLQNYGVRLPKM